MAKRRPKSRPRVNPAPQANMLYERPAVGYAALALLVLAAFLPALQAGFVWDDIAITEAEPVAEWSGIFSLWFAPRSLPHEAHYWPITYTSFWINHKLGGFWAPGFHAVNLLIHLAVCVVLWHLLRYLKVPGAWLAAAIFAVHPVHAEPVVWAIGRKELLAALFFFLSLLAWIRSVDSTGERGSKTLYVLALAAFIASLLSKSIAVTLPAVLLILFWWQRGRLNVAAVHSTLPFFLIGVIFAIADTLYYKSLDELAPDYTIVERIVGLGRVLWFYPGKLIAPIDLFILYPKWELEPDRLLAWLPTICAVLAAGAVFVLGRRGFRGAAAAIVFFVVALSPYLGLIQFGFMEFSFVADRYQYLASAGPIALVVGGLHGRLPKVAARGLAVLLLAGLSALSWKQASLYENKVVFFEYITSVNPAGRGVMSNLAEAYIDAGRLQDGLDASLELVRLEPDNASGHLFAGTALVQMNRMDEAHHYLQRALELGEDDEYLFESLGMILNSKGRHAEALELLERLQRIGGPTATYSFRLAVAYFGLGRHEEALAAIEDGLLLNPEKDALGGLWFVKGQIMAERDDLEAAANLFEQSYNVDGSLVALDKLAITRYQLQQFEKALAHFTVLADADPSSAENRYRVGAVLVNLERYDEALASFQQALGIDPDHQPAKEMMEWLQAQQQ